MSYVISVLAQKRFDCEQEVERIKALPNVNKEQFIKTQENKIEELSKAIEVLLNNPIK